MTALLGRLTHHCDIVETGNDGWRFKGRDDDHATRARLASDIPAGSDETSATAKARRAKGQTLNADRHTRVARPAVAWRRNLKNLSHRFSDAI